MVRAAIVAAGLLLGGCGYVGDPLPPSLKIPVPVGDLAAVERGETITIQFTLPGATTDGVGLTRIGEVELRIGAEGLQPWNRETWQAAATRVAVTEASPRKLVRVEAPAGGWVGREVILGVRLQGPSGRWSDWSNLFPLQVVEPLAAPAALRAQAVREGVALTWQSPRERPDRKFRIFRRMPPQEAVTLLGETGESAWTDRDARYGVNHLYVVQAIAPAGGKVAESELSEEASITPEDRFPPDVPGGVNVLAGLGTIELTWDRLAENGATYRLYRSANDGEMARLADALDVPAYTDRDFAAGTRYSYAVSAVDALGNESEKSEVVVVTAP